MQSVFTRCKCMSTWSLLFSKAPRQCSTCQTKSIHWLWGSIAFLSIPSAVFDGVACLPVSVYTVLSGYMYVMRKHLTPRGRSMGTKYFQSFFIIRSWATKHRRRMYVPWFPVIQETAYLKYSQSTQALVLALATVMQLNRSEGPFRQSTQDMHHREHMQNGQILCIQRNDGLLELDGNGPTLTVATTGHAIKPMVHVNGYYPGDQQFKWNRIAHQEQT